MTSTITKPDSSQRGAETAPQLFDDWFDPIETEVRDRARQFIEELIRGELDMVLERLRYGRGKMAEREGSAWLFQSLVLPSAVFSRARGTAISTGPKVPVSDRVRLPCRWPVTPAAPLPMGKLARP